MAKRELKKYLDGMSKEQVSEQLLELYDKFKDVKTYYDFIFNPNEDKLLQHARAKISQEYFPVKTKRARMRRSVAQKIIKHFLMLGVDANHTADVMLHNIEVAQQYSLKRTIRFDSFYKSMLSSFEQAIKFSIEKGIIKDVLPRLLGIKDDAVKQRWPNRDDFSEVLERLYFFQDDPKEFP